MKIHSSNTSLFVREPYVGYLCVQRRRGLIVASFVACAAALSYSPLGSTYTPLPPLFLPFPRMRTYTHGENAAASITIHTNFAADNTSRPCFAPVASLLRRSINSVLYLFFSPHVLSVATIRHH